MSNMVVQTNIKSLNAHRHMKNTGLEQRRAANRLASGFRINSAADDAAGLAISETMRAQIRGLDQGFRNTHDGIALIQTAEGGMREITSMVQRIRELVVQAANDTNSMENRRQIQLEIYQLISEVDSMANRVEFNGKVLLNGQFTRHERFIINEIIEMHGSPISQNTAFPLITSPYQPKSYPNNATRAQVTKQLDASIAGNMEDYAVDVLHGKSFTIGGTRFNFINLATYPLLLHGTTIDIPTGVSTIDFLSNISIPDVDEIVVTPAGQITFFARTELSLDNVNGLPFPYQTGETANNRLIFSDTLPNLRRTDGVVATSNVPVATTSPPGVSAISEGYFSFRLLSIYTQADIEALLGDRFRIRAPWLAGGHIDISFTDQYPPTEYQIYVSYPMTADELQARIVALLEYHGFEIDGTHRDIHPPVGIQTGYTLRVDVSRNHGIVTSAVGIIAINDIQLPQGSRPSAVSDTANVYSNPINITRTNRDPLRPNETTDQIRIELPMPTVPSAFEIDGQLFVFVDQLPADPPIPDHIPNPNFSIDEQTIPLPSDVVTQIFHNGAWVSATVILYPADPRPTLLDAIETAIRRTNDFTSPPPNGISNIYHTPDGAILVSGYPGLGAPIGVMPVFQGIETEIRRYRPGVPHHDGGGNLTGASTTNIRQNLPVQNLDHEYTRNVNFNFQLATLPNGDINFSNVTGIIGTGFTFNGQVFEFISPPTPPILTAGVRHIQVFPNMTHDEIAQAMRMQMEYALWPEPDPNAVPPRTIGDSDFYVTITPTGQVNVSFTRTNTAFGHSVTMIDGRWQQSGLFSDNVIRHFSGGTPAPRPTTSIDFGGNVNLMDLLPTEGFGGFTIFCASCPFHFYNVMFVNRLDGLTERPPDSFRYPLLDDDGNPVLDAGGNPVYMIGYNRFVEVDIMDITGQVMTGEELVAQIVRQLSPQMEHFQGIRQEGTVLHIYDRRRGDLAGASGVDPVDTVENQRGRLEPRIIANFTIRREIEIIEPRGLWIQMGANSTQGMNVHIEAMDSTALGIRNRAGNLVVDVVNPNAQEISRLLDVLDTSIERILDNRTPLGAYQNRLEFAAHSVSISSENLSDAESRVRNADMAREMMDFTQMNILFQAGMLMLAQANQSPNVVLQLLQA